MSRERWNWLDWMKFFGMYFIIAGHIFPMGFEFIYAFNVPLFFMISGYLAHYEANQRVFWNKLIRNLVLPCAIICLFLHLYNIAVSIRLGSFDLTNIPKHISNCLIGNHGLKDPAGGLGICWFIYTLIICKILFQYVGDKPIINGIVVLSCIILAVLYNNNDLHWYNSAINTTLSYPMFMIGCVLGGG